MIQCLIQYYSDLIPFEENTAKKFAENFRQINMVFQVHTWSKDFTKDTFRALSNRVNGELKRLIFSFLKGLVDLREVLSVFNLKEFSKKHPIYILNARQHEINANYFYNSKCKSFVKHGLKLKLWSDNKLKTHLCKRMEKVNFLFFNSNNIRKVLKYGHNITYKLLIIHNNNKKLQHETSFLLKWFRKTLKKGNSKKFDEILLEWSKICETLQWSFGKNENISRKVRSDVKVVPRLRSFVLHHLDNK